MSGGLEIKVVPHLDGEWDLDSGGHPVTIAPVDPDQLDFDPPDPFDLPDFDTPDAYVARVSRPIELFRGRAAGPIAGPVVVKVEDDRLDLNDYADALLVFRSHDVSAVEFHLLGRQR